MSCYICRKDNNNRAVTVERETAEGAIDEDVEVCQACRKIIKAVVEGKTHQVDRGD